MSDETTIKTDPATDAMIQLAIALHDHNKTMREFMAVFPQQKPGPVAVYGATARPAETRPPRPANTPIMEAAIVAVTALVERCGSTNKAAATLETFWNSKYKPLSPACLYQVTVGHTWHWRRNGWGPLIREARLQHVTNTANMLLKAGAGNGKV